MKYAVLFIALLFAGCDEAPSTDGGYEIKIDGSTIQVAKEDFPSRMNRDDAMSACQSLGNGWRLPSKEELEAMYEQLHKQGKGNFNDYWYWSSSQNNSGYAWYVFFGSGDVYSYDGYGNDFYSLNDEDDSSFQVRAVRALSTDGGYETFTIDGKTIQVATEDFPSTMNWDDAMSACQNLGNGWRLPNKDELLAMYEQLHKQGKGNFKEVFYWSSSQDNSGYAWYVYFGNGYVYSDNEYNSNQVRAVRALP